MNLIFLDTETTGNDLKKDRLCQVCYKTDGKVVNEYFKPPLPIGVKSMSITHITNKMVEDKPVFAESQMRAGLDKLLSGGILVAHNAKFDIAMLENEGLSVPKFICTLRVARYLDKEGVIPEYNLQFLRYYLELEIEGNAHDAEGDVKVLEAVFNRQLAKMIELEGGEEKAIAKMIEISMNPCLILKFAFGKHKDKKVADVAKEDRGYLEWLLRQKMEAEEEDEDWVYTLKHHLGVMI